MEKNPIIFLNLNLGLIIFFSFLFFFPLDLVNKKILNDLINFGAVEKS